MGYGSWSAMSYSAASATRAAAGIDDMHYNDDYSKGKVTGVSPVLDPTSKAGPTSPFAGTVMREVAISTEHPNPTPVAIVLDVTGSNYNSARIIHAKLPQLLGALQRIGGIEDPQIMMCFVGDAYCDRIPLQVGHFESDNKIDEMLENAVLEGGGSPGRIEVHESYELAAYFLAYHTSLETVEKQGRKGYVFFIADEKNYEQVTNDYGSYSSYHRGGAGHTLDSLIGDRIEADIPTTTVYTKLHEQYNVFHIMPPHSYSPAEIQPDWRKYLEIPERSVVLDQADVICEFIAGIMAMAEGGLELDEVGSALTDSGFDPVAVAAAGVALAKVGGGDSGGTVAKTEGSLGLDTDKGTDRI
jgi:hypothetical protein